MTPAKATVQIGDTLHLCIGMDQAEADALAREEAEKALASSKFTAAVIWPDGTHEFTRVEADQQRTEDGIDYVWHDDGDRVRCTRYRFKVCDGKIVSRIALRKSWRLFENL